jgi:glycosyltransferase involved in cell wall biosynthesis
VVPCYNEANRLRSLDFSVFCQTVPSVEFLFVNDGSSDRTLEILRDLEEQNPDRCSVLDQPVNRGKAEAVRLGMRAAFERGGEYAGYWDADLATPLAEIPRFVRLLEEHPGREIAFGARVQLLGRSIRRSPLRHYLGRVFATAASSLLRIPVYDTQCGAKLFRVSPELAELFEEPFCTNWIFDVEIVARLIRARRRSGGPSAEDVILEIPLQQWHDVGGSKVGPLDFFRAFAELARIYRRYLS